MTRLLPRLVLSLLVLLWVGHQPVAAAEALQPAQPVAVKSWIETPQPVVVRQPVRLVVEVSTDSWFTAGTVITPPEIEGTLPLPSSGSPVNFTRRENGQTRTVQQWHLDFLPRAQGIFLIPTVRVQVTTADLSSGRPVPASRTLRTRQMAFTAVLPPGVDPAGDWIVTPDLTVRETLGIPEQVRAGDVLIRDIMVTAADTPGFLLRGVTDADASGQTAHADPPVIRESRARGAVTATLSQRLRYEVTSSGTLTLPELRFDWWDPRSDILHTERLPARRITTADASARLIAGARDWLGTPAALKTAGAMLLLALAGGLICLSRRGVLRTALHGKRRPNTPFPLNPEP